jgi:hypothetical protein
MLKNTFSRTHSAREHILQENTWHAGPHAELLHGIVARRVEKPRREHKRVPLASRDLKDPFRGGEASNLIYMYYIYV